MSETFKHHEFDESQDGASCAICKAAEDLEAIIAIRCSPGREKSLAMTKLEECVMWANRAIAMNGVWSGVHDGD